MATAEIASTIGQSLSEERAELLAAPAYRLLELELPEIVNQAVHLDGTLDTFQREKAEDAKSIAKKADSVIPNANAIVHARVAIPDTIQKAVDRRLALGCAATSQDAAFGGSYGFGSSDIDESKAVVSPVRTIALTERRPVNYP